jgi:NADP+-dependent farnesol dehydrogenase
MAQHFNVIGFFFQSGNSDEWKVMFDTNVLGPSICSREAVKIMQELKTIGHIININR